MLIALLTCFFAMPPLWVLLVMLVPLIIDGTVQRCTSYESGNIRRVITGLLFGYALIGLIILSFKAVYALGWQLGLKLKKQ